MSSLCAGPGHFAWKSHPFAWMHRLEFRSTTHKKLSLLPCGKIESVRGESYPEWRTQESLWALQDPGKQTDSTTWSWRWNISQRTPVCRLQEYLPKVVRLVRTHQFILAGLSRQSITAGWDGTNKTSGPASLTKTHCLKLLGLNFHLQGVQRSDELQFRDHQH